MLVSGGGSLVSPAVNLAAIPVVMRLYGPEEYGVWGLVLGVAMILGQVSTLRFELAAVVERDDRRAGGALTLALLAAALFTLLAVAIGGVLPSLLDGGRWAESLAPRIWALPVLVAAMGLKLIGDGWAVRARAFTLRAAGLVLLAVVTNGMQIGLWHLGVRGADGLILGSVCGFAVSGLVPLTGVALREGRRLKPLSAWGSLPELARTHRKFPLFTAPYTVLGNLRREGLKIVVGAWGAEADVGLTAFAWRATYFPAQACSNGVRPVLFERAASAADPAAVLPFVVRIQKVLAAGVVPGLLAFELWTAPIVKVAVGEEWLPAGPVLRLLAAPAALFVLTNWLDRVFDVVGRQDLALRLEVVFSTLSLGALAGGLWLGGGLEAGVGAMSAVLVVYYLAMAATVRSLLRGKDVVPS